MRTIKTIRTATSLFAGALVAALLATGCDQGDAGLPPEVSSLAEKAEPTEAQTLRFSKELVISDGENEVRLLVASNQEGLIDSFDDDSFEISPVFDRPEGLEASDDEGEGEAVLAPVDDWSSSVLIEEQSVRLEEGAIGYRLRDVRPVFRDPIQDCANPNVYTSDRDFAHIDVNAGSSCAEARISTRKYSWSWYEEKAHATLCAGMAMDAGKEDTNRVKLEVCPGPDYDHWFYN